MDTLLLSVSNPPPISTTVYYPEFQVENLRRLIGIKSKIKRNFGDIEKDLDILNSEFNLFSHILYKNHNRFRNDKGYKDLRMLEKSLKKFLNHKFLNNLVNFLGFIPDTSASKIYLPTCAMGVHAQLQLYGAGAFLHRLEMLSRHSALLDLQRLNLGHFWGVSAQNLAVVGRIWILCRHVLLGVQLCYKGMVRLLEDLPGDSNSTKMPEDLFAFIPEDLVEQATLAGADIIVQETKAELNRETVTVDDFLDIGEPVKREVEISSDIGEEIKRPYVESKMNVAALNKRRKTESSLPSDSGKSAKSSTKDILSELHSLEQLKDFFTSESEARKVSRKSSFTRKLNQSEWKLLKKEVLSNFIATKPNKSLKSSRKLIRDAIN